MPPPRFAAPDSPDAPSSQMFPFALGISPRGRVVADPNPPGDSLLRREQFGELAHALTQPHAGLVSETLLTLAARHPSEALPASIAYFRDLARRVLVAAAGGRPTSQDDLALRVATAPAILGGEYLNEGTLGIVRDSLVSQLEIILSRDGATLESWLAERNPAWAVVGRVCFHLAENKQNQARPFAFLATYSAGLSASGGGQHRPLGHALAESAALGHREELLKLLLPVQRAAENSVWLREMLDSQAVFRPQAWNPAEAHRFLREIPAFEAAGLVVRVPDWWKPAAPARVEVAVTLGEKSSSALGVRGLLSFDVDLSVDGEMLTAGEWAAIQAEGAGLIPLRGKWVEVDHQRLQEVMAIWNQARAEAGEGVPFHVAMRLLAGAAAPERLAAAAPVGQPAWSRVMAGSWLSKVLNELRSPTNDSGALPGPTLRATLRPYQEHGVRWLGFLNQLGLGACLADDMGLGKTIQVLSLFLVLKARNIPKSPHLLVAPASLLGNWRAEAERFAPTLRLKIAHSSGDGVTKSSCSNADLVITTYGTLATTDWLSKATWDTVVLDEAQAIKNPGTRQARAVGTLDARVRLALTGTPVENRAGDLWSLFHFLQPGLLGTATEFKNFAKARDDSPARWGPLRTLISPYLLRRLKTDPAVAPDLPAKTEMSAECGLTREQAALYQRTVDDLAEALDNADGMARRGVVLASLLRFKQICNHPSQWLGDGGWELGRSSKLQRVEELVEPIAQRQEKVLVFTQFREAVAPLAASLSRCFGRPGLILHGGTPIKERQLIVDRFQADESIPFVVLSLKAGGTGLNLTAATHVIHFDRWWNPAVEEQATDRAFRIGQKHPVFVHKLVCRGTVEERVDALLRDKRALAKELLSGSDEVRLTEMSNDELLRTVKLDLSRALD